MSSSQTGQTSMTVSSANSAFDGGSGGVSPQGNRASGNSGSEVARIITCGALARHIRDIASRRGWQVSVHPVPAALHNRPERIPAAVEEAGLTAEAGLTGEAELTDGVGADGRMRDAGGAGAGSDAAPVDRPQRRPILAYADCGTYGKLDELADRVGASRLPGLHCYDLLAGPDTIRELFHVEPGTYLLTDYLVRTFDRTVLASLGLDRYPELWPDYFGHYTRVAWLAQEPTPELEAEAERIAALFGLPLTTIGTGLSRLEAALAELMEGTGLMEGTA